jgi:hypothetical protein
MEKLEIAQTGDEHDRFVRRERLRLLHAMQYLVEQQMEAVCLLELDYDDQARLQENVDVKIAALLAEVANLNIHERTQETEYRSQNSIL